MSKMSEEDVLRQQQDNIHDRLSRAMLWADDKYYLMDRPTRWFYLEECLLPALKKFDLKVVLMDGEEKEGDHDL